MRPTRARLALAALVVCSLTATVAAGLTPVPEGPPFLVALLDVNEGGGVSLDQAGNMIFSWNFFFGGPGARGYSSDGTPQAPFVIEPYGGLFTVDPMDSAPLAVNDFAFVWEGFFEGLQARRYNVSGTPLAEAIQITPAGGAFQDLEPAIAGWAPTTDMLVVWATDNPATGDTDGFGIDAQAFSAAGTALGPAIGINGYLAGDQRSPDIDVAANNGFLIVWQSEGSDGSDADGLSIQAHRFSAGGTGGTLFQVNSFTTGDQARPAVALAPDGLALVVWEGPSTGTDPDLSIQGRIVDASGTPLGADFQINTTIAGDQSHPKVATTGDDCFQVVWRSADGVFTQAVSADGTLRGPERPVNTSSEAPFERPTVAANLFGSVVSWAQDGLLSLGDEDFVYGQRYRLGLFSDGFESGDTSAWSLTVP